MNPLWRPDPVIRASNSVSNQDFLALAVIEGNLSKVQSVVEAYTALLGSISYCRNIEISLPTYCIVLNEILTYCYFFKVLIEDLK